MAGLAVNGVAPVPVYTAYTPTLVVGSGSLTSATSFGRYFLEGKRLTITILINITTNGTAATSLTASLPPGLTTEANITQSINVFSNQSPAVKAQPANNATTVGVYLLNNGYPGADSTVFYITGVLEVK